MKGLFALALVVVLVGLLEAKEGHQYEDHEGAKAAHRGRNRKMCRKLQNGEEVWKREPTLCPFLDELMTCGPLEEHAEGAEAPETEKHFCKPMTCHGEDDTDSCPAKYNSTCMAGRPNHFHCSLSCDMRLFFKACKVEDSNGKAWSNDLLPSEGECPKNMHCSKLITEEIYMNVTNTDGSSDEAMLKAHFCEPIHGDAPEESMRDLVCNHVRPRGHGGHRGGKRRSGNKHSD